MPHSRFDECFKGLVNDQNLDQFIKEIESCNEGRQFAINFFLRYHNDQSEIHKKAKQLYAKEFEEYEKKRKEYESKYSRSDATSFNVYKSFQEKLGVGKDEYYTDVFEFYMAHLKEIDVAITKEEIDRLKKIVFDILTYNPLKGNVEITNKGNSGNRTYTITTNIHLFGECLKIAKNKGWDLSVLRQNLLNYIPFAVYQDLEIIFDYVGDMRNLDMCPIVEAYTTRTDNLPEFMPGSFIRTCERYNISSAAAILEAFIDNSNILLQDRREALKVFSRFSPDRKKIKDVFDKYKNNQTDKQLAEAANEILIEFNDRDAIKWRIQQVKNRPVKVAPRADQMRMHSISSEESELHNKHFAGVLLSVSDEKYIDEYKDLLDYSFDKMEENNEYSDYASYLWDIVCNYFFNLKVHRKYKPILELEKYIYQKAGEKGANWFKYRIQRLKREYSSYISKPDDILTCIHRYNNIINNAYLMLKDNQDLINFIKTAIDTDLLRFVEDEGYYREIGKVAGIKIDSKTQKYLKENGYARLIEIAKGHQEDMIQKTLMVKLESIFIKNGLRNSDIIREPQLYDDIRPDFKISYGFLGPIIIEIKTASNKEICSQKERTEYKPKLQRYVSGFKAIHAYFVIFQISSKHPISKHRKSLDDLYCDCDNINVMYLNCIRDVAK